MLFKIQLSHHGVASQRISALPPKADIDPQIIDVRFVPEAHIQASHSRMHLEHAMIRFGSLADILRCGSDVRFTPESGQSLQRTLCPLCANSEH